MFPQQNVRAAQHRIILTWSYCIKRDCVISDFQCSWPLFCFWFSSKGFIPESWKDPTILRQTACQQWSAAAADIQTAADVQTDSKRDRQAGRQASVLAATSACRAGFLDDRGREKGGIKLKVAAVAELQSWFFFNKRSEVTGGCRSSSWGFSQSWT